MRFTILHKADHVLLLSGLLVLPLRFAALLPANGVLEFRRVGRVLMAVCELRLEQLLG
jgi:hypothetical protein